MNQDFLFSPYSEEYLTPLVQMWRESFENAVGVVDPNPIEKQEHFFNEEVLTKNQVRIVLDNNEVVGFIAASVDFIDQLYIHTSYQGKGIGSMLLKWAQKNSCGRLQLYTFERNKSVQQFYENKGFKAIERGFEEVWGLHDIKYEWVPADRE